MRVGTPRRSARANAGPADSSVGTVMQAPRPRSTWRRERLSWRSAAREGSLFMSGFSIGHGQRCLGAHLLEGRGLDHAQQQGGEAPVIVFEPLHDLVDGLHVVILRSPARGV